jgi:hypothetical protein
VGVLCARAGAISVATTGTSATVAPRADQAELAKAASREL